MPKAVIYVRKSTDKEDNQVLSLESQREDCLRVAEREWLEVVEIIEESMSASTPGRPGFARLISMMGKNGVDNIITWKLNRIARNPVDAWSFAWCLQNGLIKKTVTTDGIYTPETNMLLISVLFGMSTQYTIDLKKDIVRGQKTAVSKWQLLTKAPFGYKNNKETKVAYKTEIAPYIKKVFEWKASGLSNAEIRGALADKWIKMSEETVARIVANKFYYGYIQFQGEYYKWNHEPLVTKELWDSANQIERARWWKQVDRFSLKWKIRSEETWELLTASFSRWKDGDRFAYYYLKNGSLRIPEKKLFAQFESLLPSLRVPDEKRQQLVDSLLLIDKNMMIQNLSAIDTEKRRKEKLQSVSEQLFEMRLGGEIDSDTYKAKNAKLHDQIIGCDKEIQKLQKENDDIREKTLRMLELLEIPAERWKTLPDIGKSQMMSLFVLELEVTPEKELKMKLEDVFEECFRVNLYNGGGDVGKLEHLYRALRDTPLERFREWRQKIEKICQK